jgi:hypothetical protein
MMILNTKTSIFKFLFWKLTLEIRSYPWFVSTSYNQDEAPKQISAPFPPIPAIKHWNPQDSSSAITLSTIVPDSTVSYSQGNIQQVRNEIITFQSRNDYAVLIPQRQFPGCDTMRVCGFVGGLSLFRTVKLTNLHYLDHLT